jgi:transcriptional regulator with XRE-family HTH domain
MMYIISQEVFMTREKFLQHFGRRVRAARILTGLTLKECAQRSGMSYTNLSMIERGRRSMYVESLPDLARALGVSVQYLLLGDEPDEADDEAHAA